MLTESRERIEAMLDHSDLVLDVGGGAKPFARADWVIDLMGYEDRGLYGSAQNPESERFTAMTWVQRDICAREPWPFADRQFDFVVCSHTLEDVRDPIWVCDELIRVGKAGYIEVPSRLEEQTYGFQGPWVGWGHHRWLIDAEEDQITFVLKHHLLHGRESDHFPVSFRASLRPEELVHCLWWSGSFRYRERIFTDGPSLDAYLAEFVTRNLPRPRQVAGDPTLRRLRRGIRRHRRRRP